MRGAGWAAARGAGWAAARAAEWGAAIVSVVRVSGGEDWKQTLD